MELTYNLTIPENVYLIMSGQNITDIQLRRVRKREAMSKANLVTLFLPKDMMLWKWIFML